MIGTTSFGPRSRADVSCLPDVHQTKIRALPGKKPTTLLTHKIIEDGMWVVCYFVRCRRILNLKDQLLDYFRDHPDLSRKGLPQDLQEEIKVPRRFTVKFFWTNHCASQVPKACKVFQEDPSVTSTNQGSIHETYTLTLKKEDTLSLRLEPHPTLERIAETHFSLMRM